MSEIEKKLKREMDAKVPDLKEKIMAEAFPESAVRQPRGKSAPFALRRAIYSVCIVGRPRGDNNNRRTAHSSSGRHNRSREHKPACGICA